MRGSGRGAGRTTTSSASGPGDWQPQRWLASHCRRHLNRALRGRLGAGARAAVGGRAGLGAGLLLASAAAGGAAAAPAPDGGPEGQRQKPREKSLSDFWHPRRRATDVFLLLNAAVYLLNWLAKDRLLWWGLKINALISAGEVWRLVTPMFLHVNPMHLAINMYALHSLGPQVEVVSGGRRTAVLYMVSGVLACVASFLFNAAPSLGASGAVFGLGAALAVFYARHREVLGPASDEGLNRLRLTAVINVAYAMINRNLDHWGHLGGLVAGAAVAALLGPRFVLGPTGPGGAVGLQDKPPLPWLAFSPPRSGLAPMRSRPAATAASPASGPSGAGPSGSEPSGSGPVPGPAPRQGAPHGLPGLPRRRLPGPPVGYEERPRPGKDGGGAGGRDAGGEAEGGVAASG
ncbi:hypothetical protein HYH03_002435 [Edaphochlamys debaryana]|uniref:Peptidase S54 rhomboid domain-containing protein n=1 Tax=Edaphochlamys debaryana TaxID=47281 RepID=A0A835YB84_9CHLO|nr:hypothetical protein HYH03_002435 [Edaphochlamys debaryana]|eukprot:KAG2499488.1 hypothetical protein HYH03_002435 [Edaphochlamys debaryana]